MAPAHSSLDMQGDIILSLNEHAIYGTHTSAWLYCQRTRNCQIVENRGSQSGGPVGVLQRKQLSLPRSWNCGKVCERGARLYGRRCPYHLTCALNKANTVSLGILWVWKVLN